MAGDVADQLDLDRVLWVPAREPPHKPLGRQSPVALRLEMVHEAISSDPRFEACTLELDRAGPSYTIDTVRTLRARHPDAELYLIMGVDQLKELEDWHQPEELVRMVQLAVMDREGESAKSVAADVAGADQALFVPVRRVDLSSTGVRAAVAEGRDVSAWLPPGVAGIIAREGLYSDG